MKAIEYYKFGNIDVLQFSEASKPLLEDSKAIIKIYNFSLNPRDTSLRKGEFKLFTGSKFPKLTGADFSGIIEEISINNKGLKKGDLVFGYIQDFKHGCSAEFVSVPIKYLAKKPTTLTHDFASVLGCAYLTALQALRDRVKIKSSEKIIIYGASGGVGTAAIQLAKYFGAYIIAVSSSKHRDYCLNQGADEFVSYDEDDIFLQSIKADIFFQVYSKEGSYYHKAKLLLKKQGRFVCLIPNPLFYFKILFSRPSFDFLLVKSNVKDLEWLADNTLKGTITPYINKIFELDEVTKAYELLESKINKGKIVINISV